MRKKCRFLPFITLSALILVLSGMGFTYARWNERLTINSRITTGIMDFIFHNDQTCTISLADANGASLDYADSVETTFQSDGKTAEITLQLPFMGTYLTQRDTGFIRMECPISLGGQGTINTVELSPLDLTGQSQEEAVLTPDSVILQTETGNHALPENMESAYSRPLFFDVYRGVEQINGQPTAIICLSLQESSRDQLLEMPLELIFTEEELAGSELPSELTYDLASELSYAPDSVPPSDQLILDESSRYGAAVIVTYNCSLPIYVEQGRHEIIQISEGADDNE